MTRIRRYRPDDRAAVERLNARYYTRNHGFDATFHIAKAKALDRIEADLAARTGAGWVVLHTARIAGSLFLSPEGARAGRIRLFLLHPDLQGRGLGRMVLAECRQAAVSLHFETLRVSTFTLHRAACGLYRRAGFVEERRTDCHLFGRDLVQVDFVKTGPAQA